MEQNKQDTIAAIASPKGLGGVGVIRISGPDALDVLQSIYADKQHTVNNGLNGPVRPTKPKKFISHKLTHGFIINWFKGHIIDEVMVAYMQAPATYTGEDTVEVYTHGGVAVMQNVLDVILNSGARLAEPGEYTKRAFLNGKLDLAEAEAVADVINAETEKSMLSAGRNLRGDLSRELYVARETLLHIIMLFEASIDFPEDVEDDIVDIAKICLQLQSECIDRLTAIHKNYEYGCYLKQGLKLAVAGRPNVGKSSLMNTLLRQERVLVSDEAGTTRDVVTERWNIGGFPVELADTAGIHETSQNLEKLGIAKSFEVIDNCDCILFMFEAHKGLTEADKAILKRMPDAKVIGVANKTDLGNVTGNIELQNYFDEVVPVSIKNKHGLEELETTLINAVTQTSQNFDNMIIPNLRQTKLLAQILELLDKFKAEANTNLPAEYLCVHLENVLKLINTILGIKVDTDILDSIFSNFCIGK